MIQVIIIIISLILSLGTHQIEWGFYGHKKINRLAVFTLPEDMLGFYKSNIEYLAEHAIDPDKRRYAILNEATRHYIDIDHWDTIPFENVPRDFGDAILKYGSFHLLRELSDTIDLKLDHFVDKEFIKEAVLDDRYSEEIFFGFDTIQNQLTHIDLTGSFSKLLFKNELAANGTLPFFLEEFYKRLVYAFENRNSRAILKISADIGHYIADAHVPLHTSLNYNGQLTNQIGIHAFWESRLPELFAEEEYDFLVGKANYIKEMRPYIWNIIIESHALLADVLDNEKYLKSIFPEDQQFCFDERSNISIRTQCPEFAEAYHKSLNGMVEKRMQESILAVGSIWYSAWVDGGQPDLDELKSAVAIIENESNDAPSKKMIKRNKKQRIHNN